MKCGQLQSRDDMMRQSFDVGSRPDDTRCMIVGLVLVAALCAAQLLAGVDVCVTPHDQLDSDVMVYILHSEHPFDSHYEETLGGIDANLMVMASPATVIFYLAFTPPIAFVVNWCFVALVAYLGMYCCLRSFGVSLGLRLCIAALFPMLPFYSVYGLSVMGVPLVVLAARRAMEEKMARPIALVALYGAFSSPFLCGYSVVCCLLAVACVYFLQKRRQLAIRVMIIAVVLICAYLLANAYALIGLLKGSTQRSEVVLSATSFSLGDVCSLYLDGARNDASVFYHAESNQRYLAIFCLLAVVVGCILLVRSHRNPHSAFQDARPDWVFFLKLAAGLQLFALAIAVFYCAYHSGSGVALRNVLPGSLRTFQLDRFYWLYPTIWYLCAGFAGELLLRILGGGREALRLLASVTIALPLALTFELDVRSSDAIATVKQELGQPVSAQMTWEEFFAEDVFEQVNDAIGFNGENGRVASLGMHPSVALYNGQWCVDGYSNNYSLEHKRRFREIISAELDCNEALRKYFDDWGNRCYLFQHEIGRRYTVGKASGLAVRDLRLDLDAFARLGGRYLISAVPIHECRSFGLHEVGVYETETSYYRVYVYEVEG